VTLSASATAVLGGVLGLSALPSMALVPVCAALGLALAALCIRVAPRAAWFVALAAAAFLFAAWHGCLVLEQRWPADAEGARAVVVATVESIPVSDAAGWRFDASLRLERDPAHASLRARVAWPHATVRPRAGEEWRLLVALHPPRARVNPHAADAERHLFRERIHVIARVVPSRLNVRVATGRRPLTRLRARIVERITAGATDRDAAALIAALAVGHTGGMSREQWRVFSVTGTAHLVAISGLHVTLFAVVAMAGARLAWRPLAPRIRVPRESFAAGLGLAAATAYSLLAGFSVPTQRTLVMLGAWLAARACARHAGLATPFAAALIAVLALDPFAPLAAGFWLSFLAMAAIVLVTGTRVAPGSKLGEAVRVQLAVTLVLAPVTLAWFGGVSLAGMAVNLAAIPLVSLVFVPLVLLGVVAMPVTAASEAIWALAEQLYGVLWPWLAAAADAPHAMLFAAPRPWWLACAAAAALFAVLPWPPALRAASVLWLVPLVPGNASLAEDELELTLLDTGRSGAVVARTAGHTLVYGIGESFGTDGRSVGSVLLPFLRGEGVGHLDFLVLDRASGRAATGLNALLANARIAAVVAQGIEEAHGIDACPPALRAQWNATAVRISSQSGCRVELSTGTTRVLLQENAVLIFDALSDRGGYVLLPGPPKRPAREIRAMHAWHRTGATVLTTATSGAITLRISSNGIESVREARREWRRIWRLTTDD